MDLQLQMGIHLKTILDIIREDVKDCGVLNHRYLPVKYEQLISDPLDIISQVLNFSDLRNNPGIERAIGRVARDKGIRNPNQQIPADVKNLLEPLVTDYDYNSL